MQGTMPHTYIVKLADCTGTSPIGNKARSLLLLRDYPCDIPETFVCILDAYKEYARQPQETKKAVAAALAPLLENGKAYAVRSSSNLEDDHRHSYAGLFTTVLHVRGTEAVMQAIESVWQSADSTRVWDYINKLDLNPTDVSMAVMIQEMVSAQFSGVVFTRNPVTGVDETIVEAVTGTGDGLVQTGMTPLRWVANQGGLAEIPNRETIPARIIDRVIEHAQKISRRYGKPLDLEWSFDGQTLYWLQMREIPVVHSVDVYTNTFSKEFLPGIIKPLVWSINIPLINGAWIKVLTEMIGPNDLNVHRLAKAFYYRAYFNTGVIESIFHTLGFSTKTLHTLVSGDSSNEKKLSYRPGIRSLKFVPRIFIFILDKIRFPRKVDPFLRRMEPKIKDFRTTRVDRLTEKQLLGKIETLLKLTGEISYYYLVTPFIVFVLTYLLRTFFAKEGTTSAEAVLAGSARDVEDFDPNVQLAKLHQQFQALTPLQQQTIRSGTYSDLLHLKDVDSFKAAMIHFMERFGHISDSGNDFSCPPWRATPSLLLKIVTDASRRAHPPVQNDVPLQTNGFFFKRWLMGTLFTALQNCRRKKEAVSYLYTYSYGLLRDYFLALGYLYSQKGSIAAQEDIFYLFFEEIKAISHSTVFSEENSTAIVRRKDDIERYRDIALPTVIYGDQEPPIRIGKSSSLTGIATSRGYACGPVKVVTGINDYAKMCPGDILVIPYSDIGLAPLFARAAAIISESGGMLSHCSIIAREYTIPAITAVEGACSLPDNTLVSVDGFKGEIIVQEAPAMEN
jgi:phosphohistidine swiveling domain-containing protein